MSWKDRWWGERAYWAVVGALRQLLAGDVVVAGHLGRVPGVVVNAARRLVNHSVGNAVEDDVSGDIKVDDLSVTTVSNPSISNSLWGHTKFMSTSLSRLSACFTVRGNPSSRKLELGQLLAANRACFATVCPMISSAPVTVIPEVVVGRDSTQPRFDSSPTISLTITESLISPPLRMTLSACIPSRVRLRIYAKKKKKKISHQETWTTGSEGRTFSRRISPDEIADNRKCSKSRPLCVPFPDPGGPTRITRAAFRSLRAWLATEADILFVDLAGDEYKQKRLRFGYPCAPLFARRWGRLVADSRGW